jgi:uncharacterized protein YndB with AHSA1/START domain
MSNEVDLSYSIWIQASADRVWETLTDGALSSQYFPYALIEGDWREGGSYAMRTADGAVVYDGTVLKADRPHRLVQSCNMRAVPDFVDHVPFTLEWVVEEAGDVSRLTIRHEGGAAEAPLIHFLVSHCPDTASGIKTLLETGRSLRVPSPARAGA